MDIWFPSEPNKVIKCPVTLTNKTDDLIGVCIKPTGQDTWSNSRYPYVLEEYGQEEPKLPLFIGLRPHSSVAIFMTMRKQEQTPLQADKGMFDVVMVATKSEEDLNRLGTEWYHKTRMYEDPLRRAKEFGTVVHVATLRAAVTHDPALRHEVVVAHQVS